MTPLSSHATHQAELLEKLRRLNEKARDIKGMKATAVRDYNDQLAEIDKTIKETLEQLKTSEAPDDGTVIADVSASTGGA
jgi:predicted  nucleic acid-binding Zn-ribbon protein